MAKKQCPKCSSTKVQKYGYVASQPQTRRGQKQQKKQRYYCSNCKRTFTQQHCAKHKRHTLNFIKETIQMYVESKSSSREVAKAMNVDHATVLRWTNELGAMCLNTQQTNHILNPKWKGIFGLDGKIIRVGGKKMACLIATDVKTLDIAHWELTSVEDESGCRKFLINLRDQIDCLYGIITDLGRGRVWIKLMAELFPDIPHQACIVHFDRYVNQILPRTKKSKHFQENQILRQLINNLLYASNFSDSEEIFARLQRGQNYFKANYQRTILKSLGNHFDLLTNHFHYPELERTNNVIENIIKHLDRKMFLLSDFQTSEAAHNFLNLWVCSYRFKPITSSNFLSRNGLSPLQIAGVHTGSINWLDFALVPNN